MLTACRKNKTRLPTESPTPKEVGKFNNSSTHTKKTERIIQNQNKRAKYGELFLKLNLPQHIRLTLLCTVLLSICCEGFVFRPLYARVGKFQI